VRKVPIRTRATVLYGPNDLRLEEVDLPDLEEKEVLVRVAVDGICPSGVHAVRDGIKWGQGMLPGFPGDEFSGEVVEAGEKVEGIKVGDRVVGNVAITCGRCCYCMSGRENLCSNRRLRYLSWAEHIKIFDFQVHRIPDHVTYEEAAFAEPLACALHGVKRARIKPGDDVLIVGSGPMGLLHLQLAKKVYGARVIAVDLNEERLRVARSMGADGTINPGAEDIAERVDELTEGIGANSVIVTVGDQKVQEDSLKFAASGGTVVLFAGIHGVEKPSINVNLKNEVDVRGSFDKTDEDFVRALKLICDHVIDLKPLITHRLPLEKYGEGMEIVERREGLKVMLYP
jgi:L-iditol 2-dehydrogenase